MVGGARCCTNAWTRTTCASQSCSHRRKLSREAVQGEKSSCVQWVVGYGAFVISAASNHFISLPHHTSSYFPLTIPPPILQLIPPYCHSTSHASLSFHPICHSTTNHTITPPIQLHHAILHHHSYHCPPPRHLSSLGDKDWAESLSKMYWKGGCSG